MKHTVQPRKHLPMVVGKIKSPLLPKPPLSNPKSLKRKFILETMPENSVPGHSDSVKVIVRMRPPDKEDEEGEMIVQKTSSNSLSVNGQRFTFDSVADIQSTQQDIFELVGAPLVENCLSGFNSSVFAYGQTGSGKTYTMLGPPNALLEENPSCDQQGGLTSRVFELLFDRINEEKIKHAQLEYQCHCSFLEIYNEQISDLLDPNKKNLQIRKDVKSGVFVENLTEECVRTMKDVTQLLIKGLSNRRTGATSTNSDSSRSHSVFTCDIESRCKSMADGIISFKTSRINLVDLAGSERQKLTGAVGERLKEAGNINRSLSQLGNLINILAEVSQSGKQRHIPYRDSKLTFLLQESLGGNAKLAMVCAISPAQSCQSETLSTLKFAQRAKAIKNKAVLNEVMQDDVNVLRDVIQQLKDELHRKKVNESSNNSHGGYTTGWNARKSLNLLKFSLSRPMTLPHIDDYGDEEMEIVEEESVKKHCVLQPLDENNASILGGKWKQEQENRENHVSFLTKQTNIQEGIEISALKAELEKVREDKQYLKDENDVLRAELRDAAEAVQAAGELLLKLKEAEEAVAAAQKRAIEAERETEKAYKEIEDLKQQHERGDIHRETNDFLHIQKRAIEAERETEKAYKEIEDLKQQHERGEIEALELTKLEQPSSSWFSGHDSCNI